MIITYQIAKQSRDYLETEVKKLSAKVKSFDTEKTAMGLTPDSIKFNPDRKAAVTEYQEAFSQLQNINTLINKQFKKEAKADRKYA